MARAYIPSVVGVDSPYGGLGGMVWESSFALFIRGDGGGIGVAVANSNDQIGYSLLKVCNQIHLYFHAFIGCLV